MKQVTNKSKQTPKLTYKEELELYKSIDDEFKDKFSKNPIMHFVDSNIFTGQA